MAEAEVRDAPSLAELQETVAELVEQRAAVSEVLRAIVASPHELQPRPRQPRRRRRTIECLDRA